MARYAFAALVVAITLIARSGAADTPPPPLTPEAFVGGRPMPGRERDLIALLRATATDYQSARTARVKADLRLGMELKVTRYMAQSQDAVDWLGVVRGTHSTLEGHRWLSIDIAPDVNFGTFQNRYADVDAQTLIHQFTPLGRTVDQLVAGDIVKFSGKMLILDVTDNDAMVLRPHIIVRFKSIEPAGDVAGRGN